MPRGWATRELVVKGASPMQPKIIAYLGRVDTHRVQRAERLATAALEAWQIALQHAPKIEEVKVSQKCEGACHLPILP